MKTVLVSGVIANKYLNGGAVWTRLNWILGLKKLGFQVYFVEQIGRESCVDSTGAVVPFEASENLRYFASVVDQFHLSGSAALVYENGERIHGLSYSELLDVADEAAFLINISGHLSLESVRRRVKCKVYVDLDPGFTQFWQAAGNAGVRLACHDFYFTVGENIGTSACAIPTCGLHWRPIRQPVVLDEWTLSAEGDPRRFTTIGSWRGPFGPVAFGGRRLGLKVHEFRKVLALPTRVRATFELALDIYDADEQDRQSLQANGWTLVDPHLTVPDPASFRRYVQNSGAEFSVAQEIYVDTNSGWFSDRTVRYLASGKPALVQDTGFSRNYPVGEGLVTFRTLDEAVQGAERILRYYEEHCRAARRLAEEYFDSDKVLGRLMDQIGVGRGATEVIAI